ncbi:MAG TPA: molecular chaperone [Clostridiales bacterium]|nr:molecular chaperone [Clostridiales bacterium]
MTGFQAVFERHEKKYILDKRQYDDLADFLQRYMEGDAYGLHTVSSLYFDTDSYSIIRASNEKPMYKEKLRLRSYGTPSAEDTVFLELKKKFEGIVYKRRIPLGLQNAERYLRAGIRPRDTGQIFEEIDWFVKRHHPQPKAMLCCDRLALCGKDNPAFRVTFDFKIRWRDYDLRLSRGSGGAPLLAPGLCLMEIKTDGSIPLWLGRYLSQNGIYPTSFSKYGMCYKDNLIAKKETGGMGHVG